MQRTAAILTVLTTSLALAACAGGISGSFKGNGNARQPAVDPAKVKVIESRDHVTEAYTELGVARGKGPTAQIAVDQAKFHCGRTGGGNLLIMNTPPFESDGSWRVDATCARGQSAPPADARGTSPAGGRAPQ